MNRYYNRYEIFERNGEFDIVPGIILPEKPTDKYVEYKRGRDRFDKFSMQFYNSPYFGWLILHANPAYCLSEFEILDGTLIRIPFPLITSLQDYKKCVEEYREYYGK